MVLSNLELLAGLQMLGNPEMLSDLSVPDKEIKMDTTIQVSYIKCERVICQDRMILQVKHVTLRSNMMLLTNHNFLQCMTKTEIRVEMDCSLISVSVST